MLDDELLGESNWRGPSGLRKKPFYRRTWFNALLAFAILTVAGAFGVFVFMVEPLREKAETFDLEECKKLEVASIIYDRNGGEVGRLFMLNRTPIKLNEVPAHFRNALMSQEDSRFYEHKGVDYVGLTRAIYQTIRLGKVTQGASTITQQLARQTFDLKEKKIQRKIVEAFVAMRLEKYYSKDEIMELYLNRIYFGGGYGQNFYGIQAAARGYFGKDAHDLTLLESATICGLIKAPNLYSPIKHKESSIKARNMVLRRMLDEHYITQQDANELEQKPLITTTTPDNPQLTYVYDQVRQETIKLVGEERAATGGFHIYTSIDPVLQAAADKAVQQRLKEVEEQHKGWNHQTYAGYHAELDSFRTQLKNHAIDPATPRPSPTYLQGAALVINNADGSLLAVVGGRDFKDNQFNRAMQAKAAQGTSIAPFVFACAFSRPDFYPASQTDDMILAQKFVMIGGTEGLLGEWGQELPDEILPRFSQGQISFRDVLVRGQNSGTVRVGEQVGVPALVDMAAKAGLDTPVKPIPASYLGGSEARLDEMCLAYSTFPNKGMRPKSVHVVNRIADTADQTIYQLDEKESALVPVMDEIAAWQTHSCMVDVMERGTGSAAKRDFGLKDFPVAGKTGTDVKFANLWHFGYSSAITCGVWVGFDKPTTLYPNAFSNRIALPIWTDIMNATLTEYKPEAFTPPESGERKDICTRSGMLATDFCYDVTTDAQHHEVHTPTTYQEIVRPGTRLGGFCTFHKGTGLERDLKDFYAHISPDSAGDGSVLPTDPKLLHVGVVRPKSVTVLCNDDPFHSRTPVARPVTASVEGGPKIQRALPVTEDSNAPGSLPLKLKPPESVKIEQ